MPIVGYFYNLDSEARFGFYADIPIFLRPCMALSVADIRTRSTPPGVSSSKQRFKSSKSGDATLTVFQLMHDNTLLNLATAKFISTHN